jgi:serine/threonine protein kinase
VESSEFTSNKVQPQSKEVLIGQGGACDLYRIMIHNKFHVVKRLKTENRDSPNYIEALRNEFEIGFQLDHPNIVRYLKYEEDPQNILIEFIDGVTLSDVIEKQLITLSNDVKKKIVLQLCSTIEYLHSKQIYHLDLKPDNLMITLRGKNLKLIDFGHAMTDSDNSTLGGTKGFSPPEQSENTFTTTNDIYSIGKVIEFIFKNEPIKELSKWNPIFSKCQVENPKERYDSITDLITSIESMEQGNTSKKRLIVLTLSISLLITVAAFVIYPYINNSSVNSNSESINSEEKFISNPDPVVETHSKAVFTTPDSIYCSELGLSLYHTFIGQYAASDQSVQTGSELQTKITDSIQSEWFNYSAKFEPSSIAYNKAYDQYTKYFTESQMKIMEHLYSK